MSEHAECRGWPFLAVGLLAGGLLGFMAAIGWYLSVGQTWGKK